MPQALALVAATHVGRCVTCQKTVAALQATGGALLDELPPVALAADALDRLLPRLDQPPPALPPILNPQLWPPLNRIPLGRWWPLGIGVRYCPLRTTGNAWGGLILAQPRRALLAHGHAGLELTCVLSGAFIDGGEEYLAGDVSEPILDHDQPPRVIGTEPCLCVIASEGMRLHGLLGLGPALDWTVGRKDTAVNGARVADPMVAGAMVAGAMVAGPVVTDRERCGRIDDAVRAFRMFADLRAERPGAGKRHHGDKGCSLRGG